MNNLRVLIIGAGIGGLTAGLALRRVGYEVEIFERTHQIRPAGAGISLWSNGVKVLNTLGLGKHLAALGGQMNRMEYRSHRDEILSQINLLPLIEKVGQRPYPIARTDLQALLFEAVGAERIHLGYNCQRVEQDDHSITAWFEDGTQATGDLLIGADGIRSTLRQYVLEQAISPRYAGYVNWNGLVEASDDLCDRDNWVLYVGEGKRASMMPVGHNRFYFFFGCPMSAGTTVAPTDRTAELKQIFGGWPDPVQRLMVRLDRVTVNRLEICDLDPLERFVRGRVALLGDAAHATTPTLGQGGCQAIEDAEVLTRYLISTTLSVTDALKRYEIARRERTAQITLKARKRTNTIYGKDPIKTQQWYTQLQQEDESEVIEALAKVILGGPFN